VGCGADEEPAVGAAEAQAFVAGDGTVVALPPSERQPAPDLVAPTLDGGEFSLADQQGKVVVMNVWASWCAPCRSEAPELAEVYQDSDPDEVQFVGLATRDSEATAAAFVRKSELDYPHVLDTDGSLQLLFRDTLPPQAIPSTLVIDREGRVAGRALGEVSAPTLRAMIEPLLDEGAA
ncbi:MAG: TlpA family protein disulfide reductase, partial [Actinomycetia bacterium]|nr:TlpA family protein disulfide reductase [Actinomycetes bacterium]